VNYDTAQFASVVLRACLGGPVGTAPSVSKNEVEDWFRQHGLPRFVADEDRRPSLASTRNYPGYTPAKTERDVPGLVLMAVYLLQGVVYAFSRDYSLSFNVLAVAASVGFLYLALILVAKWRWLVLGALVLAPAVPPLFFDRDVVTAAASVPMNALLVAVMILVVQYGVLPMTRWAMREIRRQIRNLISFLVRALTTLLLVIAFLFMQSDVWEVAASLHGLPLFLALLFTPVLAALFVWIRISREIDRRRNFESVDQVREFIARTELEKLAEKARSKNEVDLTRSEKVNLCLIIHFALGLQFFGVAIAMGSFLVLFGMLAITPEVIERWTTVAAVPVTVWGYEIPLITTQLLKVASLLGLFSGMYYVVSALAEETYRKDFLDELDRQMDEALAILLVYREMPAEMPAGERDAPGKVSRSPLRPRLAR
jgi:hypothetical protein